jgi:hypothetical protein
VQTNKDPRATLGVAANNGCLAVPILEEVLERRQRADLFAPLGRDSISLMAGVSRRASTRSTDSPSPIVKGSDATVPRGAGMSLDEDDRIRAGAEVGRFLRSVAPGS